MKTNFIFLLAVAINLSLAGQSKREALETNSILWFGLDFSEARFTGKFDFKSPYELKEKYIPQWNQLMLHEAEKYNIRQFYRKTDVKSDFGDVYRNNEAIDETQIILGAEGISYEITEETIQKIVSGYVTEYDGYGLVLIVENFNKIQVKASVWVTFFYIPTKEVVFTKRVIAEPAGFGLRNYWAGAIHNIMKISSTSMEEWLQN
jgi:hypothetical protein